MILMIVAACQTAPEEPKGPQTYKAEFTILESHKIPTLAKWKSGKDSGTATLSTSGSGRYQIGISLASPPSGPVTVDLYRVGIHYYEFKFEYNGSLTLDLNPSSKVPNELAIELLKRLGDNVTDSRVIAEVARSLVDNDTVIKSDLILAGKLPGLDTAKVVQEALKLLVAKNLPLKELVPSGKWILNIDTLSIHVRIRNLSLAGILVADTNKLFPPYPVRVKAGLAISGELLAGGGALAVSGIFEATNKLVTSSVKIFRDNDEATAGFDFPVNFDLLGQPSKLDLSGKLSIAAKPTTAPGTYRLEIVLQDQDAFSAKATLEIKVLARPTDTGSTPNKDTDKPRILRQTGTKDSTVAYDVSEMNVGWTVSDASPVKVTIQGSPVTAKDGAYTATVLLGSTATVIRIKATDSASNEATDSVIIRRGAEPGAPTVSREPGTKDSTVAYNVTSLKLAWKISDASQVTLNGTPLQGTDGLYTFQASSLKVGTNGYKIVAKNAAGKQTSDSLTIVRAYRDSIFPVIVRSSGTENKTVPHATETIVLSWTVTDNDKLLSVTIGGLVASAVGDIHSATLPLKPGENIFYLVASDTAKNTTKDSVIVTRTPDVGAPVIAREAGTKDSTVAYATTTFQLRWKVTDDVGVASVEINGAVVTGTAGIYSLEAKDLVVGKNGYRIVAKDAGGKSSYDSVTILRLGDTSAPKIAREAGTKDSAVAYATTAIQLSWKVTDEVGLASVEINGTAVTGTDGIYSLDAKTLAVGKHGFKIVAKDAAGNSSSDSVTIVRAWKDTIAPSIVRQTGTGPKTVAYEDSIFSPAWKVTDTLLKTVSIQGAVATGAAGIYSAPIPLPLGRTLVTLTANDQATNTASDTFSVVRSVGTIADLSISQATGTYDSSFRVTLQASVADAVIMYTIDGSDPTTSSTALTYSSAVLIDRTRTLKAFATAPNRTPSAVATRAYTLVLPSPVSSLPNGTVADTVLSFDLSCRVSGADIYYTLDGSIPTANSTRYYVGSSNYDNVIDSLRTLKAIAIKAGWTSSPVVTLEYKANVPVKVFLQYGVAAVVRADGSLWTSGNGYLMDGTEGVKTEFDKVMEGVKEVTQNHILKINGDLYAYGDNTYGVFGNGTTTNSATPVFIRSGVKKVVDVALFSLILDNSGKLYAAGDNTVGNFCNETTTSNTTYTQVSSGIANMAIGYTGSRFGNQAWTLFVTTSGEAYGCGSGTLGPIRNQTSTPTPLGSGYSAAFVADAGGSLFSAGSFLLKSNGDLYSTGGPTSHLYSGALDYYSSFVFVRDRIKLLTGKDENLLILDNDGAVWAVGNNYMGALGDGTMDAIKPPKTVMSDVKFIASSGSTSFFIKKNGTLWAAGNNANGTFGNGTTQNQFSPVRIRLP